MKAITTLAALAFAATATAAAASDVVPGVITVSCYRGPTPEVVWDHPRSVFIDSLVAVGYDYNTATSIATRICRDERGVYDPEVLKAQTREALRNSPMWLKGHFRKR
ncbi:hypothetical protein V8J36_06430 [Frigidibacter sp. MR17.14]|uniref:hypothetical protein n=1 Tax=Frigidibacter sp. MR17.14 TaxID=3126509 RepID=UPI003012DA19